MAKKHRQQPQSAFSTANSAASSSLAASTVATTAYPISAFGSTNAQFAAISTAVDAQRLKIWDTWTSTLLIDWLIPTTDNTTSTKCTCLAWGALMLDTISSSSSAEDGKRRKKRKHHAMTNGMATESPAIALGMDSGDINLFLVAQSQVSKTLSGVHTTPVTDVCFAHTSQRLYSGSRDGIIVEWDLSKGSSLRSFASDMPSIQRLVLSHDDKKLLAASYTIQLYDLETSAISKTFTGHAAPITQLSFNADSTKAISAADGDNFICLWDCTENGITGNAAALTMDVPPVHVNLSETMHVLAITGAGQVDIWDSLLAAPPSASTVSEAAPKKKKKKNLVDTRRPDGHIVVGCIDQPESMVPILAAQFADGQIVCARGSPLKPAFERLAYLDESGQVISNMHLLRPSASSLLVDESTLTEQRLKASHKPHNDSDMQVIQPESLVMPEVRDVDMSDSDTPLIANEPSLADRVAGLIITPPITPLRDGLSNNNGDDQQQQQTRLPFKPSAASLYGLLSQAIQSGDRHLMEQVLSLRDPKMVATTVYRLSGAQVLPFLDAMLERLQKKPLRASALVEWIRAVLVTHAPYLTTVPNLSTRLSTLYSTLETRTGVFSKLVLLQGRLDFVMTQIETRKKFAGGDIQFNADEEAEVVYNEEDDIESEDGMDYRSRGGDDEEDDENQWEDEVSSNIIPRVDDDEEEEDEDQDDDDEDDVESAMSEDADDIVVDQESDDEEDGSKKRTGWIEDDE
ncbi:hypothetical protein SmJEL517_g00677 [Synchytrium microbalum]|uniref:Small-subunit processome Utp12 domain-containing protein n=1 Tax=Synchytrium microbalum TaxID=1806994 RepID=A0A507CIR5_9FUNG|nr:uncharacterized protein SmJEL517_g00677 [Synchytrium microbalum]TPX37573.1 hypothetical protein SmJEL517_g00677 [Synchytrium microbalum]